MHTYLIVSVSVSCRAQGLFSHPIKTLKKCLKNLEKCQSFDPPAPFSVITELCKNITKLVMAIGGRGISELTVFLLLIYNSNEAKKNPKNNILSSQNLKKMYVCQYIGMYLGV